VFLVGRFLEMEALQAQDPEIDHIVISSKFVVTYLLQQDPPNPGWRKANIEGPCYLVRRRSAPRYQIVVKNQLSGNDFIDDLHPDWELDCQKNYVFYKVEDPKKTIRGLWFHDDSEKQIVEAAIESCLEGLRKDEQPQDEAPPAAAQPPTSSPEPAAAEAANAFEQKAPAASVTVTMSTLRSALHALAEDETFLRSVMLKLEGFKRGGR